MHRVAFNLVVYDFARYCCGRTLNLLNQAMTYCACAHIAPGCAFFRKILSIVDVGLNLQTQRASAAQEFYGKKRPGWPCAYDRDAVT